MSAFGNVTSFISAALGFVGTGVLDIIVVVASAAATGVALAILLSCITEMQLKGKDYDQQGSAAMMVGFGIGAIVGAIICVWLLCTSTVGSALLGMLGVCAILAILSVAVVVVDKRQRHCASLAAPDHKRFRSF